MGYWGSFPILWVFILFYYFIYFCVCLREEGDSDSKIRNFKILVTNKTLKDKRENMLCWADQDKTWHPS